MHQILLAEGDHADAAQTRSQLTNAGYAVDCADSRAQLHHLLKRRHYDLILLEDLTPRDAGASLCGELREKTDCPILFLSVLDDDQFIVKVLSSGADGYIVKPVQQEELLARMEVILRRCHKIQSDETRIRSFRSFELDTAHRCVLLDGEETGLSATEYELLSCLADRPDTVISYHELYRRVWGNDSLGDIRTVMVHISNLRKKLGPERSGLIETIRGKGYRFRDL